MNNIIVGITHVDVDPQQLLKKYRDWMAMNNHVMPVFAVDARKKDDVLLMVEALIARAEIEHA